MGVDLTQMIPGRARVQFLITAQPWLFPLRFVRFEPRTKRKRRRTTAALAGVGLKAVIDFARAAERADHHSTIGVFFFFFFFSNNFFW